MLGEDVLLIERFDRTDVPGQRGMFVSALTILQLPEMAGRYATYYDLADVIRSRCKDRADTLRELFARITFNVCVGNTDDHARSHAAFWDGEHLTLMPAYDICPQARAGGEAAQTMAIVRGWVRLSQLTGCVDAAREYELSANEARATIHHQIEVIRAQWSDAADAARLTTAERHLLWGRQILNPFVLYGC